MRSTEMFVTAVEAVRIRHLVWMEEVAEVSKTFDMAMRQPKAEFLYDGLLGVYQLGYLAGMRTARRRKHDR